mmetsp:Transcript_43014/g.101511  ORF Transcript_43014/g.101511 Transcript_43014/m.101511 type:complete len:203 (-) Transcript_43014:169-777(-)
MFLLHYYLETLLVFMDFVSQLIMGTASMPMFTDSFPQHDIMNTYQYNGVGDGEHQERQEEEQAFGNVEPQDPLGKRKNFLSDDEAKARELKELEKVDLVRGNNPGSALRRTTKKLSSMMTQQQIFDLQRQEQQRAQDLQHRAIEKVLLEQNKSKSKQTKEAQKLLAAITKAKETAFTVNEYSTHSSYLFEGYQDYAKRQTYA